MLSVASVTLASPVYIAPFSPHTYPTYHLTSSLIHHTRSTWVSSPSHLPSSAKRPRWSLFALLQATLRRQYHLNFDLAANILLLCLCLCASFSVSVCVCVCLCLCLCLCLRAWCVRACMAWNTILSALTEAASLAQAMGLGSPMSFSGYPLVCRHIYMYTYIHIYIYILCVCVCVRACVYVCMHTNKHTYAYT